MQVQLFFKQEGMHTAVHEAWNNRIMQEFGHPMNNIEKLVDEGLERVKASLPHLSQLAITACLEHWTAGLGHVLLCTEAGEQTLSQCAEPYRSLWYVQLPLCGGIDVDLLRLTTSKNEPSLTGLFLFAKDVACS